MAWEQGQATIDDLLRKGALVIGDVSATHGERALDQARQHIQSAMAVCEDDPTGGYVLSYEAASKALAALLVAQGLRPRPRADSLLVYDAVCAQFEPPFGLVLQAFLRLRARRIELECSAPTALAIAARDVHQDLLKAKAIVYLAERLMPMVEPYRSLDFPVGEVRR